MKIQHIDNRFDHSLEIDSILTTGQHGVVTHMIYCLKTIRIEDGEEHRTQFIPLELSDANYEEEPMIPLNDLSEETCLSWIWDRQEKYIKSNLLKENLKFFLKEKPAAIPVPEEVELPWVNQE